MVDWWDKLRRAWVAITSRLLKSRNGKQKKSKSDGSRILEAGSNNARYREILGDEDDDDENGYLKLRNDVENSEYEDIHVLWNILSQMQAENMPPPSSSASSPHHLPSP